MIFTLISLLSFSPADPSVNNAVAESEVHNLFGKLGAFTSGILIGLFGIGAFWIPILLMLASVHFLGNHAPRAIILSITGGIVLAITTGSLLALQKNNYLIFGIPISSGGLIGIWLKSIMIDVANPTGGFVIFALLWIAGFILATGFSICAFAKRCSRLFDGARIRLKTTLAKRKSRREKTEHVMTARQSHPQEPPGKSIFRFRRQSR